MTTSPIALYYPHTSIASERLLKTALLLWDRVECITPHQRTPLSQSRKRAVREAAELVVTRRVPTPAVQRKVHDRFVQLLAHGVPTWLQIDMDYTGRYGHYLIYPQKLADQTWHMLVHHGLAAMDPRSADYAVPSALGLLAMSMLADECAGSTRTKVTDRERAYAWLLSLMTDRLGGKFLPGIDHSHLAATYDRLVTLSVRIVNTDTIPLSRLVAFRKREAKASGGDYRALRIRFLTHVGQYVERLTQTNLTDADRIEIERQYQVEMNDDLHTLKSELLLGAAKVLLSKEIGVCALAVAGALAVPATAPATLSTALSSVGVGALIRSGLDYRAARRETLRKHPVSWLYVSR